MEINKESLCCSCPSKSLIMGGYSILYEKQFGF